MTDDDKRMLDLAGARWNYAGNLEQAVRDEFDISLTRFFQRVNRIIDAREALEYSPHTVNRLRRIRSARPGATR